MSGIRRAIFLLLMASPLPGCGQELDTTYGRSRGQSVNGTGVLAALFRDAGHTVRPAWKASDELSDWAEVIVRFAPYSSPPEKAEGEWLDRWLSGGSDRRLIYVVRDYDARADYWNAVLTRLPRDAPASQRERAKTLRDMSKITAPPGMNPKPADVGDPETWFALDAPKPDAVETCKALDGPWSRGVDPSQAVLPRHRTFRVDAETVLLEGDGKPLAIGWTRFRDSQVLAIAGGAFLLNAALAVNPARRPWRSAWSSSPAPRPDRWRFSKGRASWAKRPRGLRSSGC